MKRACFSSVPLSVHPTRLLLAAGLGLAVSPLAALDLAGVASGTNGFVIEGAVAGDFAGYSVAGAGDVNGDGLEDIIVGAPRHDLGVGDSRDGAAWVVLGRTATTPVALSNVTNGTGGFVIRGAASGDQAGTSVSGVGDLNGDGLWDVVVGAPLGDTPGRPSCGRSFVVFGRTATTAVQLSSVVAGTGGFVINGANPGDKSGTAVSGVRDMNGDGVNDLIIGAPELDTTGYSSGGGYVVFGKSTGTAVELSRVANGTGGFVILGESGFGFAGSDVSGVGDFNGDGLGDAAISAPNVFSTAGSGTYSGAGYMVFGKSTGSAFFLSSLIATEGTIGQALSGFQEDERLGASLDSAGDVNGDGLSDMAIGSAGYDLSPMLGDAGASIVLFGRTGQSLVNLASPNVLAGSFGFGVVGTMAGQHVGESIAGGNDTNGDGLADILTAHLNASPLGRTDAGQTVLAFGKTSGGSLSFNQVAAGTGGLGFEGATAGDQSGSELASLGDVNGDGRPDLVVAAHLADGPAGVDAGRLFVVFNTQSMAASAPYRTVFPTTTLRPIAVGVPGNGQRSTPDSRLLARFNGVAPSPSLVTATLNRTSAGIVGLENAAGVAWRVESARTGWTSVALQMRYLDSEIGATPEANLKLFNAASLAGPWTEVNNLTIDPARNIIAGDSTSLGWFAIGTAVGSFTFTNDADGDGYSDAYESLRGSNPASNASVPNPRLGDIDADNDVDAADAAALAAAIANGTALSVDRAGIVDDNVVGNIADDTIYNAADVTQLGLFTSNPQQVLILR